MALTRRDWRGAENLGRHGEGIVVAPNHISFLDPLIMAHFLHDNGRPPRFMGKQSVFEIPLAGQLIRGAGQIPVSRDKDPHKALAAAEAAVTNGECLVMYPEGTITRDPGTWPMSGKTGALRVALETGAPLIPIAQWGANEIMPPYTTQMNVLPAEDDARDGGSAAGHRGPPRAAPHQGVARGGHRPVDGCHHRAAGGDPGRDGPGTTT